MGFDSAREIGQFSVRFLGSTRGLRIVISVIDCHRHSSLMAGSRGHVIVISFNRRFWKPSPPSLESCFFDLFWKSLGF